MGRGPIFERWHASRGHHFSSGSEDLEAVSGISPGFPGLSQSQRQVTHVLLTRAPLYSPPEGDFLARLACVRHAASVRSEPGSNSPVQEKPESGGLPRRPTHDCQGQESELRPPPPACAERGARFAYY